MLTEPKEEFLPMIRKIVGKDDPVIFEIGANDGTDTERLMNLFPRGRIFAFEPDPRAIRRFRERLPNASPVVLTEAAIGRSSGRTTFHQSSGASGVPSLDTPRPEGWDCSGSIRAPSKHLDAHPWCTFEEKIEVAVLALDDWMASQSFSTVDFIWADVQGAEQDLIAGASRTLSKTRYFYTEYNDTELYEGQVGLEAIKSSLADFDVYKLYVGDVLFRNKSENRMGNRIKQLWGKLGG